MASSITMPAPPLSPIVYEVRTSVLLSNLSGCTPLDDAPSPALATLADIPDAYFQQLSERGIDILYLMGVWQTGSAAIEVSRDKLDPSAKFLAVSSPFAVQDFHVHKAFGGDDALRAAKAKANKYGLRIMIDFIPNHVAKDHKWVKEEPWLLVQGTADDATKYPGRFFKQAVTDASGKEDIKYIAYGRDMYSTDGWVDTAQLNYWSPDVKRRMTQLLVWIASTGLADGVRCDMAMLVIGDVFERVWAFAAASSKPTGTSDNTAKQLPSPLELGLHNNALSPGSEEAKPSASAPFEAKEWWCEAIAAAKAERPSFLFLGEVYWDLEFKMHTLGFDYTYDKPFYDKVVAGNSGSVATHLQAHLLYQRRSCRFIENHDERRAYAVLKSFPCLRAAAVLCLASPGMRFLHDGQLEGRCYHHSMHIGPRPIEPVKLEALTFYKKLLRVASEQEFKNGMWHLAATNPSKDGNDTFRNIIAMFITPANNSGSRLHSTASTFPLCADASKSGAGSIPASCGVMRQSTSDPVRATTTEGKLQRSSSSDSQGSVVIPEFVGLKVQQNAESASKPVSTAIMEVKPAWPTLRSRIFLVVCNLSERASDGHILFSKGDPSAYNTPEGVASVDVVFRTLCNPSKPGVGIGLEPIPHGGPLGSEAASKELPLFSAAMKVCFMDHLSDTVFEYPLQLINKEGWWVRLPAWSAHIFEVFVAGET